MPDRLRPKRKTVKRAPARASLAAQERSTERDPELERFYESCFMPLVRRAVRRYRMSIDDAKDLAQDAFVVALARLDPTQNPRAWLYQVLDNLCVNFRRKTLRRAQLISRWGPEPEKRPQESGSDDY